MPFMDTSKGAILSTLCGWMCVYIIICVNVYVTVCGWLAGNTWAALLLGPSGELELIQGL